MALTPLLTSSEKWTRLSDMAITIRLDVVMAMRKMRSNDLAEAIDVTEANLSRLKTGKIKALRLSTLDSLCRELSCTPGELLEYTEDEE